MLTINVVRSISSLLKSKKNPVKKFMNRGTACKGAGSRMSTSLKLMPATFELALPEQWRFPNENP